MLTTNCMLAIMKQQRSYGETGYHRFGGPEPRPRKFEPARTKSPAGELVRAWNEERGCFE